MHRERRGEHERLVAHRARLRRRGAGAARSPRSAEEDAVRDAVRAAGIDPPADVHARASTALHLAEVLAVRAARQAQRGADVSTLDVTRGDHRHDQRRRVRARGGGAQAADPLHPRRPRPDRQPHRLRHRQLRRLLGDRRRHAREELHDARRPGRRLDDRDGRGPRRRRRADAAAAGVQRPPRAAVRLLHAGDADERDRAAARRTRARPRTRSRRRCRATSAAAPATGTSSRP